MLMILGERHTSTYILKNRQHKFHRTEGGGGGGGQNSGPLTELQFIAPTVPSYGYSLTLPPTQTHTDTHIIVLLCGRAS